MEMLSPGQVFWNVSVCYLVLKVTGLSLELLDENCDTTDCLNPVTEKPGNKSLKEASGNQSYGSSIDFVLTSSQNLTHDFLNDSSIGYGSLAENDPLSISGLFSGSYDNLTIALLKIHFEYCGDIPSCFAADAHQEPEVTQNFRTPCCVPCSCLPTCIEKQNCCPDFRTSVLNTQASDFHRQRRDSQRSSVGFSLWEDLENIQKAEPEGFHLPPQNFLRTHKRLKRNPEEDENNSKVTEILGSDYVRDLNNSNNTNDTNGGYSRKILDNVTETVDNTTNDNQNSDQADIKVESHLYPKTVCSRPQVIVDINQVTDAQAYRMIVSCPEGYPDDDTIQKCKKAFQNDNLYDIIPVTSLLSRRTYANKHCLRCNELKNISEIGIETWKTVLTDIHGKYHHKFYESLQDVINTAKNGFGRRNIHFEPRTPKIADMCTAIDVSTCNYTGLWGAHIDSLETMCRRGPTYRIISRLDGTNRVYRNIACVLCNTGSKLELLDTSCFYIYMDLRIYMATLNVLNFGHDEVNGDENYATSVFSDSSLLRHIKSSTCRPGFLKILGHCRRLICPRDYYIHDGQCFPLYESLFGYSIQFMITTTPQKPLHSEENEILKWYLNNKINETLHETINLSVCEKSLTDHQSFGGSWQGELLSYYVSNIKLYSPKDKIMFKETLKQIRHFLKTLNEKVKKVKFNSVEIDLSYQFSSSVNVLGKSLVGESEGYLSLLEAMHSNKEIKKCSFHALTVSSSHYCLRAVLFRNETLFMAKYLVRILQTGRVLHALDFDLFDPEGYIAVCIDVFQEDTRTDTSDTSSTKVSKDIRTDDQSDTPWYLGKYAVLTWCIFGILILLVVIWYGKRAMSEHRRRLQQQV